jgi:outer membrane biosynthesis protein TonB
MIEVDGNISNIKILQSSYSSLNQEAIRLAKRHAQMGIIHSNWKT